MFQPSPTPTTANRPSGPDPDPVEGEQLVAFLEPDQLVVDRRQPLPRARLGRGALLALLALRLAVTVLGALVIYTFFAQLG